MDYIERSDSTSSWLEINKYTELEMHWKVIHSFIISNSLFFAFCIRTFT